MKNGKMQGGGRGVEGDPGDELEGEGEVGGGGGI